MMIRPTAQLTPKAWQQPHCRSLLSLRRGHTVSCGWATWTKLPTDKRAVGWGQVAARMHGMTNPAAHRGLSTPDTGAGGASVWDMESQPIRVVLTGAAGQIGYHLAFLIARGHMFGDGRKVILHLLDLPACVQRLTALEMELTDTASPLLAGVVPTTDPAIAFSNIDVALLVGASPRQHGQERRDLLKINASIFVQQGQALNELASKNVKVVVVGNPANTNALVLHKNAPSIPRENITALMRLDSNRFAAAIGAKLQVSANQVHQDGRTHQVVDMLRAAGVPQLWGQADVVKSIQQRGAEVIRIRGLGSSGSAAIAICDHMRDWLCGTGDRIVSMGIVTDGSAYNVPAGLVFSMPVTTVCGGKHTVVKHFNMDGYALEYFNATLHELQQERDGLGLH